MKSISEPKKKKDGKHGEQHNAFSIMKFVKGDPNFEAFWQRFLTLKDSIDNSAQPCPAFPRENYFGNTEYKLKLVNPDLNRVEHLTTQMKFRLKVFLL
jgi:hypothetical protein